jgi:hypothetical protein
MQLRHIKIVKISAQSAAPMAIAIQRTRFQDIPATPRVPKRTSQINPGGRGVRTDVGGDGYQL